MKYGSILSINPNFRATKKMVRMVRELMEVLDEIVEGVRQEEKSLSLRKMETKEGNSSKG